MLKNSTPKNGRVIFLSWLIIFFIVVCLAVCVLSPYLNIYPVSRIFPFLSSTTNRSSTPRFYGENIDMSRILPTSQYYVVNSKGQDLIDISADLGINLLRITNGERSFGNEADSIYTEDQWNQVLSKMQRKGIKALILIETASHNQDHYTPDIRPVYLDLVQEYINSGVFAHPNVYAVDIKNEPELTDANISILQTAHTMIKAKYPHLLQTIGSDNYDWSAFSAGQKIASIVDFYSLHMYLDRPDSNHSGSSLDFNQKTKWFISQAVKDLQTTKPILIEEFGAANGDVVSDQNTIGSPELQAKLYLGVYQALKEMQSTQILGAVAFNLYSRYQHLDAWAIVKNHGDYLFPAAYVLQEYALGKK